MTRTEAVDFLAEQWPALAATFGIGAFDSGVAGWKASIDSALGACGVARADRVAATVDVGDEAKYEALLRYYGARLLYAEATSKVDMSITGAGGISKRNGQMADQLAKLLKLYTDDLAIYGVAVGAQMTMGRLNEDFLEPELSW